MSNSPTENDLYEDLTQVLGKPTRILVVDDEEAALMVIPETLRDGLEELGWTSLTIETAQSGEEAVEIGRGAELNLLVADVVMPGIDGIETYAQLKKRHPQLACVVMTAHAPEHVTPIRALRLGAADYVQKPINPEYLVETCHRQLLVGHLRRAVDESRLLLEGIVSSVSDGVVAIGSQHLLSINAAAEEVLGSEFERVVERLAELGVDHVVSTAELDDSVNVYDVELPDAMGRHRSVSVVGSPILDKVGQRLGNVFVMRDITDPIERQSLSSFKRMAAIAAHEMKNSVTGLGLVTQHLVARLQEGQLDAHETERMANIILDSVARLDRFARRFLDFSKLPTPKPVLTTPNALVTDTLALYGERNGLPDWVSVTTELSDGLPNVLADKDLFFQVLQNLIINSVEAMEGSHSGQLILTTREAGEYVCFALSDNGDGISQDMQERIFEPNITTREAGSGLGLVIVRDVVMGHGGKVRVSSEPGNGATFEVFLPSVE